MVPRRRWARVQRMETPCAIGYVRCLRVQSQTLTHQQILVPARMIVDRGNDLEAVPLVECWHLEGERHQHDLRAAAPSRFLLGRPEQLRPEPLAALRLVHPELAHLA